jgi:hypothetical protein
MHIGYPGSGKTGALASLLNVGYKIRVLSYEGNFEPLVGFADERALDNLDVVVLQDRMRNGDKYVEPIGIPESFNEGLRLMKEWKYKDDDGNEINLGKSSEWGPDTIVVVDSLTSLGHASKRRAMKMNNKNPSNMTSAVWGHAVADVTNFIDIMKADSNRFHLIINTHKQIIGPGDFINQNDDKAENSDIKEAKMEMIRDGMIPPRIYPVGVTKPSSQNVHGMLPTMLEFDKTTKLGKDMRLIRTVSGSEIDVKVPAKNLKKDYPIETGLAEIFAAMGYEPPDFK